MAMTDRDTFAAAALTGLLAQGDDGSFSEESYARAAYRWADAMLAFRDSQTANKTTDDASSPQGGVPDSRKWKEPVAWGIVYPNDEVAVIAFKRRDADELASASDRIVPLYRHPPCQVVSQKNLTLTDEERDAVDGVTGFLFGLSDTGVQAGTCQVLRQRAATLRKLLERLA